MQGKIININKFNQKSNTSKNEIQNKLKQIKKFVNENIKKVSDIQNKMLLDNFNKIITNIQNEKLLSYDKISKYLDFIKTIPENEEYSKYDENYHQNIALDIAVYTNMVLVVKDKIFTLDNKIVEKIMISLIMASVSCANYPKYLPILFSKEIIDKIVNYNKPLGIEHILADIMQDNEIFSTTLDLAIYKLSSAIKEETKNIKYNKLREPKPNLFDYDIENIDKINTELYNEIYNILLDRMQKLSIYFEDLFQDKDYKTLNKVKLFKYLEYSRQIEFLTHLSQLDKNITGIISKIPELLDIIDYYSNYLKKGNILTLNFRKEK